MHGTTRHGGVPNPVRTSRSTAVCGSFEVGHRLLRSRRRGLAKAGRDANAPSGVRRARNRGDVVDVIRPVNLTEIGHPTRDGDIPQVATAMNESGLRNKVIKNPRGCRYCCRRILSTMRSARIDSVETLQVAVAWGKLPLTSARLSEPQRHTPERPGRHRRLRQRREHLSGLASCNSPAPKTFSV